VLGLANKSDLSTRLCQRSRLPSLLELDGTLHGVDCATELHQRAVAGHFEDAALMAGNHRLEHILACKAGLPE
jgi:hypothetical protein